ncbi:hypothetical protein SAMN05444157_0344 [Frankineae bacterium MT45]|nr:hypothetical protein SAMN05444157_0344 [Frankineae bacterium MT45]
MTKADRAGKFGRLPVDDQLSVLRSMLERNTTLVEVLSRSASLSLPGWYLTAGCVFQTVWNVVSGRDPDLGIKDYDLFYFDDRDLSWDAEDIVVKRVAALFADLPIEVEVRNEARVHLWYEQRFGVACPPHTSTESAIDSFAATTCCLGVRLAADGAWQIYAPHGLSDVFNMILRPNPVLAPADVYRTKAARWSAEWPQLVVLDWPR